MTTVFTVLTAATLLADAPLSDRTVTINDTAIRVRCAGTRTPGSPMVVLEAGAGNGAETWEKVQPAIADFARVCAYDRPTLRRSWRNNERPPAPPLSDVVDTLDSVLTLANERPPYVLVGHSYGGMIVRLFATRFPERVKGLVLIDSSHEDQIRRFAELDPSLGPPPTNPAETLDLAAASAALDAQKWHASIPLLVLTRGNAGPANASSPPDAASVARYRVWLELNRELATRSPYAEQIIAQHSGHYIHNDEPPLVIDGVRRIVAAASR